MKKIVQKSVNVLLVLSILLTSIAGLCITTQAQEQAQAQGTSVEIVSFVRGKVDDLRSSELLEARVSGYNGNLSDLTFTWSNQLGTYLYVYNSSNMYNIKDTAGEVEISGTYWAIEWQDWIVPIPVSVKKDGETVSLQGYAWAAVYGAELGSDDLDGYISVTVTDKNGNVVGSATYDNGFGEPNLKSDLMAANYGLFEGETIDIKDMLGRSSIVHIDCVECKVSNASITSGENYITLQNNDGNYSVSGKASGAAKVSVTLKKNNCKFHQNSNSETVTHNVYIFKKPVTTTTTTTMTLTNIDEKCDYFIDSIQGTKSADGKTVVFTGLTPDTVYEVTVRGKYVDENVEKYVYAYVSDTTKPVFKATVCCYTDDKLADFLKYFGVGQNLFFKESAGDKYIALDNVENAVYTAEVDNGVYYVYYKDGDKYTRIGDYQLTIDNENSTLNIYTYSLRYDLNGGEMDSQGGVYYVGTPVYATSEVPQKAGAIFTGWTYAGKTYKNGQLITEKISEPVLLTAKWDEAVPVKVNIEIDHTTDNDGYDVASNKSNIDFRLVDTTSNATASDKVSLSKDSYAGYTFAADDKTTKYIAQNASFNGAKDAKYTVACMKSGYEVMGVEQTTDADGTIVLTAKLKYDPKNFDLAFDVVMNKDVPKAFYPAGVDAKITYWTGSGWECISQHKNGASVYVEINDDGTGSASYPVWKTESDTGKPYYYSIEIVSYVLDDGSVVSNASNAFLNNVYIEGEGAYPGGDGKEGAYFAEEKQYGVPTAEITINSYDLTFNANGGKINGSDTLTLEKQVVIPDLLKYVPTRNDGYTFTGWYTDSNCTTKAVSGTRIYANTTLYAGWKAPLSVSGVIEVEGFYFLNNERVKVLPEDRAENIVTTLQVKYGESYNDIMSIKSVLDYDSNDVAKARYQFDGIPDILTDGTEYRIRTVLINYETLYDNNSDDNFANTEYVAQFGTGKNAVVDALLKFKADEFVQNYEIDATLIGEGFRPKNGITQILFQTYGSTPPKTVISQHTVPPYGEAFSFENNGIAKDSLSLWKGISNGTMSTYQLKVTAIDGKEYNDASTYTVRYGATTSYSVLEGGAGTLKAKLVPKEYVVNFDLNADGDVVGDMDAYMSTDGKSYFTMHRWSHNTPIAAMPTRDGYVFVGWEAEDGVLIDGKYVAASVDKEVTLKAKWAEFKWVTDTDSGYIEAANGKESVVRFLFDVATTEEIKNGITQTGIKLINSSDINGKVENSSVAGEALTGSSTTFYGDITSIPESNAGVKYYAIGFVVCNGKTYWSLPVECGPDFNDLILYN